jgi:hypothetical protein
MTVLQLRYALQLLHFSSGIEEGSGTFENKSITRGFSGTAILQAPKLLEIVFQLRPYLKYALFCPFSSVHK